MTSFQHLFKALWQPKFRLMNWILAFWGLAVVVTVGYQGWVQGFSRLDYNGIVSGWAGLAAMVALIWLAVVNERVVRNDTFRLMPVSVTKLYLTNLVAAFGTYLYLTIVTSIVSLLSVLISPNMNLREFFQLGATPHVPEMVTAMLILIVLLIVGTWVVITLIHLATNVISAFLPGAQQRIVKIILAIILVIGLVVLMRWLFNLQALLISSVSGDATLWITLALGTVVVALAIAVNSYLLKHWVEARY